MLYCQIHYPKPQSKAQIIKLLAGVAYSDLKYLPRPYSFWKWIEENEPGNSSSYGTAPMYSKVHSVQTPESDLTKKEEEMKVDNL